MSDEEINEEFDKITLTLDDKKNYLKKNNEKSIYKSRKLVGPK